MACLVITTRAGDNGTTSLANGKRIEKDNPMVELYGTLDECQAHLGMARAMCEFENVRDEIMVLEDELFRSMGWFAGCYSLPEPNPSVMDVVVNRIKERINAPFGFVRPGDSATGAALHLARTVARRAERIATPMYRDGALGDAPYAYLNRLSDAIYAVSLWIDNVIRKNTPENKD